MPPRRPTTSHAQDPAPSERSVDDGHVLSIPRPGVTIAELARAVYAAAGAGEAPRLDGDERLLADRVATSILGAFDPRSDVDLGPVVDTASTLIDELYAHLPLKRARYGIDPSQRLHLLRQRCGVIPPSAVHRELADVFTRLRDAHTRYIGPTSLQGCVAYLPFLVEEYGPAGDRRYLASHVATGAAPSGSGFAPGVELLSWNGIPLPRAVEVISDGFVGSHADARRARGIESMTQRSLQFSPLPDEHWVIIGYRANRGAERELRFEWRVFTPHAADAEPGDPLPTAAALGVDHEGQAVQRARAELFSGRSGRRPRRRRRAASKPTESEAIESRSPALSASTFDSHLGALGYLRIWNFSVPDHESFIDEARRLLGRLPDRGLIIDVRNNPGGLIWAAERMLQLLTPDPVRPTRFSLPVTGLTRRLVGDDVAGADLLAWQPSVEEAVSTGEAYSQPIPLTDESIVNDVGQCYGGPVVCLADARTYSSGDLFCAGFVDNDVGPLITVGSATGGGGANVWDYQLIRSRLQATGRFPAQLPDGCSFTLAFRRATRTGANEGRPIEDVGVAGALEYAMTRDDLLDGNVDLVSTAVGVLAAQRFSRLALSAARAGHPLTARTKGLDSLVVTVDGTSTSTVAVTRSRATIDLPDRWSAVEVEGWGAGQVLQRRRLVAGRGR